MYARDWRWYRQAYVPRQGSQALVQVTKPDPARVVVPGPHYEHLPMFGRVHAPDRRQFLHCAHRPRLIVRSRASLLATQLPLCALSVASPTLRRFSPPHTRNRLGVFSQSTNPNCRKFDRRCLMAAHRSYLLPGFHHPSHGSLS